MSDFQQLEMRFMQSIGGDMEVVLPRDDEEVFKAFLSWAVVSAKRARSLNVIVRTASLIMAKTERPNVTKNPGVKAFIKALHTAHGEEPQAKTAATRRMLRELIHSVIPRGYTLPSLQHGYDCKLDWKQCAVSVWGRHCGEEMAMDCWRAICGF